MNAHTARRLAEYNDLIDRLDDVVALEALRRNGVFSALVNGPMTLEALADATQTAAPRLRAYLDLVRHLGFLQLERDRYGLVAGDEGLFGADGLLATGHGLPDLGRYLRRRAAAVEVLANNTPLASPATGAQVSAERREEFLTHVHQSSQDVAAEVAQRAAALSPRHIADLGCGPGTYTVAMLHARPDATAVLVDRENAGPFVTRLCAEAGLQARTQFLAADILSEDYGQDFDLILLSENIHNFGIEQNRQLLRRACASLRVGGHVLIKDTQVAADRSGPLSALRFAFALALFADQGTVYSEESVCGWLGQTGFVHERTYRLAEQPGSYLIVGRKL